MKKRIFAFIKKKYLCTVCCADGNQPWANAFYYVFDEANHRLIYVTNENTHHAKVMSQNPQVAGTIFTPTRFNPSLQGLQFTGIARKLIGEEKEIAVNLYKQAYSHPLIDELSTWEISLQYIRMIDHTLGFYGKLEWDANNPDVAQDLATILE